MTGDPTLLVDRYSAKSGRSWEDKLSHLHPINCSHSETVKFPEHDENCEVVLGKLKKVSELAPAVIRARCGNDLPAPRLVIRARRENDFQAPNPTQKHLISQGTSAPSESKTDNGTWIWRHGNSQNRLQIQLPTLGTEYTTSGFILLRPELCISIMRQPFTRGLIVTTIILWGSEFERSVLSCQQGRGVEASRTQMRSSSNSFESSISIVSMATVAEPHMRGHNLSTATKAQTHLLH